MSAANWTIVAIEGGASASVDIVRIVLKGVDGRIGRPGKQDLEVVISSDELDDLVAERKVSPVQPVPVDLSWLALVIHSSVLAAIDHTQYGGEEGRSTKLLGESPALIRLAPHHILKSESALLGQLLRRAADACGRRFVAARAAEQEKEAVEALVEMQRIAYFEASCHAPPDAFGAYLRVAFTQDMMHDTVGLDRIHRTVMAPEWQLSRAAVEREIEALTRSYMRSAEIGRHARELDRAASRLVLPKPLVSSLHGRGAAATPEVRERNQGTGTNMPEG